MDSTQFPQELIDLTISHIKDPETLASMRLASSSCRKSANPFYFKWLFIMLSSKSVANVAKLIQSPYREYVEEIHWVDRELQDHLEGNLDAFQDTFKKRLAGLSRKEIIAWHEKYRLMYRDQEYIGRRLHEGDIQLNLESFVNLKKVSVNNGCGFETEKYPAALSPQEIPNNPAKWSTIRQLRPRRGGLYALILKPLAESQISHNITHFSITTEGSQWDNTVLHPNIRSGGPIFMFEFVRHLDINLCLQETHAYGQHSTVAIHLMNRRMAENLQSLTIKLHPHDADSKGNIGIPLTGRRCVNWASIDFRPRPSLYPQLRHLELHRLSIHHEQLVETLWTLKHSLKSLILVRCVFRLSLLEAFMKIRELNIVPPTAIFKHRRDYEYLQPPKIPSDLTEEAITPFLLWTRMNGTLTLQDWDKQVKEYVEQNSANTKGF